MVELKGAAVELNRSLSEQARILTDRVAITAAMQQAISGQGENITKLKEGNQQSETGIKALMHRLDLLEATVQRMNETIAMQTQRLNDKTDALMEMNSTLSKQRTQHIATIANLNETIIAQAKALFSNDLVIMKMNETIQQQDRRSLNDDEGGAVGKD
eukprot:TRINITY_DN5953_c0_g1_i1.p1 TRINITY_DN5953_c0_g1~~TRINITY_DN5953_c0_g1_i1.p1  ORF type:complete len:158 (+),score=23.77 TRINITY_DN5953_c0_g1_i1:321-794(+)